MHEDACKLGNIQVSIYNTWSWVLYKDPVGKCKVVQDVLGWGVDDKDICDKQITIAPLDGDVPQRVWTRKDISYQHLKVFDCLAYVHVAKDKWRKLDPKTRPCIFLGYGDDEFGYRQWNLQEKKVAQSRDIVFMEEKNISYLDSKMKTTSFESTNRDRLEWTRIYLDKRRIPVEEQYESAKFGQKTEAAGGAQNAKIGKDPESDSDEEPTRE